MARLCIFDLDGTLGQVRGGDGRAYVAAIRTHLGDVAVDTSWERYPNTSDAGITRALFREHRGREPTPAEMDRVRETFRATLEHGFATGVERFDVIPGAHDALRELPARHGWDVALATGGWRAVQQVKLARGGFDVAGIATAFSDAAADRATILRTALRRATERTGATYDRIVYVGDAPWDVRTCAALGWPFVGVARHDRSVRLRTLGATHTVPDFVDLPGFLAALDAAGVPVLAA